MILNSAHPESPDAVRLAERLEEKYGAPVALVSCLDLDAEDIRAVFSMVLEEFPAKEADIVLPAWTGILPPDHRLTVGLREAVTAASKKMKRLAVQYNWRDDLGKYLPTNNTCGHILGPDYDSGGAGVLSTCADYAKFAETIANGGISREGYRFLAPRTVDLWRTNALDARQRESYNWSQLAGYGYGLGVRTHINRAKSGGFSPLGEFGWSGAAGAYILIDPENKVGFFYAHHMLNNQEYFTTPRLRNLLYSCLGK